MIEVSNPLRLIRVHVSRLTKPTDPSKGTVWKKTYAVWPSSAL